MSPPAAARPPAIAPPTAGTGRGAKLVARLPLGKGVLQGLGARGTLALTIVLFVALVAAAWVFRAAGGVLALGGFIGALWVLHVAVARAALRPIGALLGAVRPLALVLLVLVAAALVKAGPAVQLVCGLVLLLVGWHGIFGPAWDAPGNPLSGRLTLGGTIAAGALPVLFVGALMAFLVVPVLDQLERTGRASTALFFVAVALLLGALILRLGGFARTRLRALVTATLALALTRLAMQGGLIRGHDWLTDHAPGITTELLLIVAGATLVLACLAEIAIATAVTRDARGGLSGWRAWVAVQLEAPLLRRSVTDAMSAFGLLAAALAACALAGAVIAATSAGRAREQFDKLTLEPIRPGHPARATNRFSDAALARMYSPVLLFTAHQRWTPIKVDDYLRRTRMTDWKRRTIATPPLERLPDSCPGIVSKPCYTLRCVDEDACFAAVSQQARDSGAVYVRVERRGRWAPARGAGRRRGRLSPQARSPNPFSAPATLGEDAQRLIGDTSVLVQYWYFYPYDEWLAPVLGGQFKQRHEADWEAVTIGLGKTRPLYVAYSSHCGGSWSAWDDIRVADNEQPRLHPLVAVAQGSQANYRAAEARRAPDWAKCAGLPAEALTLVSYAANLRDLTDSTTSWTAKEHVLVHATTQPMRFLGRWAPNSRTTLENARKGQRLGRDTPGPATPTLQPLWFRPLATIFGGGAWHEEQ
ncbi:MAG: hypothetical protein QOE31_2091 [Solirubrobacteraceae bacterium]|nr:hypothetical protein [Solirubrobacteraceae bacterium]